MRNYRHFSQLENEPNSHPFRISGIIQIQKSRKEGDLCASQYYNGIRSAADGTKFKIK